MPDHLPVRTRYPLPCPDRCIGLSVYRLTGHLSGHCVRIATSKLPANQETDTSREDAKEFAE